ncbi:MAG: hypothetical protein HY872_03730 [Chloroflexi bacterium]|nr:hypothetical protein [Chloroflexota bacterium]
MLWDLHGVVVEGQWDEAAIGERWVESFASRPQADGKPPTITFHLSLTDHVPPPPPREPQFRQGDLLQYFLDGARVTAHFPRFGQLRLDCAHGHTEGQLTSAALDTYGVFEDLIAIGLSPHLRRRGMFLLHAFAASPPPRPSPIPEHHRNGGGGAVLIVGHIGAGKTTTGMALLNAGWKLLSNDSPIITAAAEVLSYPGLLAAYPDTLARFETTAALATGERKKITVTAERLWPDVWRDRAPAAAIVFPQIEGRMDHALEPVSQPEALRLILPHAIEQWDRAMIPAHLAALNALVQSAPAYRLRLGPEVSTIPERLARTCAPRHRNPRRNSAGRRSSE